MIFLLSDFGRTDSYVAEMKAVLLRIAAEQQTLIDISHDIPPYSITHGAHVLAQVARVATADSVFLAVVDPGVGSSRKRLLVEIELKEGVRVYFVGPDNGLISRMLDEALTYRTYEIMDIPAEYRFGTSTSFDGRDVFAPAAALVSSRKLAIESFCRPLAKIKIDPLVEPLHAADEVQGEILYFDAFGNAATNLERGDLEAFESAVIILEQDGQMLTLCDHFLQAETGSLSCMLNSQGRLELFSRKDSARLRFKLEAGMRVLVRKG